jgi:hypothetical protein
MASTHELVRLEELTTTAVVLSRIVLDDPEARVVAHWHPTKMVGKLPESVHIALRSGDIVVVDATADVVPFADGESRTPKDFEARHLAARYAAARNAIQLLSARDLRRRSGANPEEALKMLWLEMPKLEALVLPPAPEPVEVEPEFEHVDSGGEISINGETTTVICGSSKPASKTPAAEEPEQEERPSAKPSTGQLSKVLLKYMAGLSDAVGPTDIVKKLGKKYSIDRRQAQNLLGGLKNRLHVKRTSERRVPSGHLEGLYVITKKGRKVAEEKS